MIMPGARGGSITQLPVYEQKKENHPYLTFVDNLKALKMQLIKGLNMVVGLLAAKSTSRVE